MSRKRIFQLILMGLLILAVPGLLASCSKKMTKEEAQEAVVSGVDGGGSQCITLYLVRHGDKIWKETDHLMPACIPYPQAVVSLSLEQKEGTADSMAWRLQVRYVYAHSQPPMTYLRTFWFDQADKELADKELAAMVQLGAVQN
jgi:hypothetical protein